MMANTEADTTQLVLGATSALKQAVEKQVDIKAVFLRYQILESDYLILAGFDQALIEEGAGYFQEIQIFCSNDVPQDTFILRELGKVLSPTPATIFTPSGSHHTPVFDKDGKVRSRREVILLGARLTMSTPSVLAGDFMQDLSGPSPTKETSREGREENNDGGQEESHQKGKSKEWQANQDGGGRTMREWTVKGMRALMRIEMLMSMEMTIVEILILLMMKTGQWQTRRGPLLYLSTFKRKFLAMVMMNVRNQRRFFKSTALLPPK
jgi:hypothetical protein